MVAIIKTNRCIDRAIKYNEQKLKQGKAELIHSMNYAKDTDQLNAIDKIKTIEKLTTLNRRTKVNCIHIFLSFPISESLPQEQLRSITDTYMQNIGFGEQPYLVYQHYDAVHPHLHVVTTNIQRNGQRIGTHHLLRDKSNPALREIEINFGLSQAQGRRLEEIAAPLQKAIYGQSDTSQAIGNVLNFVIPNYKYTSLEELNTVLRIYNVMAEGGLPSSRMYKHGGLVYRMLNEEGRKIGAPINASNFSIKPTLKSLQLKFASNRADRQLHDQRIKNAVDLAFIKGDISSIADLEKMLLPDRIQLIAHKDSKGNIHDLAYIDHEKKLSMIVVIWAKHIAQASSS